MWGVVDLLNRLQCKFTESTFEQMLWFFRTAGQQDFDRIKKAVFSHMGVIPQGVSFVPRNERFKPDPNQINMGLGMMRQILSENAASYVQDFDQGGSGGKEMTATETMARVNNVNTMVSGMLNLAYTYQTSQYREIARRFCIKNSPYADVQAFRKGCLTAGVPADYLDSERWDIEPERTLGGGNKTLEIAQANQLLQMRQFLGPDAQRRVDHIAVEVFTDDPALAEDLAPTDSGKPISKSQHDAQLATERILRGLQFEPMPQMVFEDYVRSGLQDMGATLQILQQTGMPTMKDVIGLRQPWAAYPKVHPSNRRVRRRSTAPEAIRRHPWSDDELGQRHGATCPRTAAGHGAAGRREWQRRSRYDRWQGASHADSGAG